MAATNWLVQIDKGEYLESWDNAAHIFKIKFYKLGGQQH